MSENEPPKIEFPCDYPIKVIGDDVGSFREDVLSIIRRHAPDLAESCISYRASRGGRYLSVKVTITATGEQQLRALFEELKANDCVQMVL